MTHDKISYTTAKTSYFASLCRNVCYATLKFVISQPSRFHFRIPGARSSRARRKKATPALFQHQSLALRHSFDATDWPRLPVVGPERVQFWSRAMCSHRANKSAAPAAEDVGVVRAHRNRNRISECISDMQSKSRGWLMRSIRSAVLVKD